MHPNAIFLRGILLAWVLVLGACATAPSPRAPATTATPAADWDTRTVHELQASMADGSVDAERLTRHFLDRIAALDDAGPHLDAVIELNPDALSIAAALDRERTAGRIRGPLHGIPILLKDNIDTDDRMATSAGSLALATHHPGRDATLVTRLREAGAVILGKTNLSEWANFRSTRSISGWSARGGQTRNPHVLDRNPCGSSAGSAVAVAAGLAPLAVGTETDGSIVCPAAVNGVVGMKPSLGLVSRHGIIPIAHSQDTAGPIARTVADAALLLSAMAAPDPRDAATIDVPRGTLEGHPAPLSGLRVGVLRRHFGFHSDVDQVMDAALKALEAAGAELVDPVELPTHDTFGDAEWQVLLYEFRHGIDVYLNETEAPVRSLEELIAYNRAHADREMRWFGQEIFEMAAGKGPLDAPEYLQALAASKRLAGPEGIDAILSSARLDVLVAPTTGPAWVNDPINGDHYLGGSSSAAAVAGYPNITVPVGDVHGLPVGMSIIAGEFSDDHVLAVAHAVEQVAGSRPTPRFERSLGD